jgi:hypothetical protein
MGEIIPGGVEYFMNGRKGSASFQVQWHKRSQGSHSAEGKLTKE